MMNNRPDFWDPSCRYNLHDLDRCVIHETESENCKPDQWRDLDIDSVLAWLMDQGCPHDLIEPLERWHVGDLSLTELIVTQSGVSGLWLAPIK